MAKKKCEVCGAKVNSGDIRCRSCGIPLVDLNKAAKKKIANVDTPIRNSIGDKPLNERTLYTIERLDLYAKLIKVLAFFSVIALAIYAIFSGKWVLLILCFILYFVVPFVALPVSWMQLMLENLYEMKIKK